MGANNSFIHGEHQRSGGARLCASRDGFAGRNRPLAVIQHHANHAPVDKFTALAEFDGSVVRTFSTVCRHRHRREERPGAGLLREGVLNCRRKKPTPYMEQLRFSPRNQMAVLKLRRFSLGRTRPFDQIKYAKLSFPAVRSQASSREDPTSVLP